MAVAELDDEQTFRWAVREELPTIHELPWSGETRKAVTLIDNGHSQNRGDVAVLLSIVRLFGLN